MKMNVYMDNEVGFPAFFHYDPYFYRFMEHMKSLIKKDYPIIVRLHPGAYYPMENDDLNYRVDREGHVVAIVGFDDEKEVFIFEDPWNSEKFGGERSGRFMLPYNETPIELVDATLDAMTVPVPWGLKANHIEKDNKNYLAVEMEYTAPIPLSRSYYHVYNTHAKIEGAEDILNTDNIIKLGDITPGEKIKFEWELNDNIEERDYDITISIRGLISNEDPYPYNDVIGVKAIGSFKPSRVKSNV